MSQVSQVFTTLSFQKAKFPTWFAILFAAALVHALLALAYPRRIS